MIDIMENLQQYVPLAMEVDKLSIPGVGEREVHADKFHHLLFGGDQLTAKRARGSQHVRNNSLRGKDRLEGLKPVVEDWHAKVCLLGISCTLHPSLSLYPCTLPLPLFSLSTIKFGVIELLSGIRI